MPTRAPLLAVAASLALALGCGSSAAPGPAPADPPTTPTTPGTPSTPEPPTPPTTPDPPPAACAPSCAGRTCGDDGCGGSCGGCGLGLACGAAGACASPSCPPGLACLAAVHTAYEYACARASAREPWTCARGATIGGYANEALCRIGCAGGESACHEADTYVGAQCRACEASCTPADDAVCVGEGDGSCPAPCACR